MLCMPMAATVPRSVAATDATRAIRRVFPNAPRICSSRKSSPYHLKVKPVQTLPFPSLNEKAISTAIGA